ncbi:MAG TPA: glycosyltransferase family 4 protein [Solirubrobacteraceae bacterium]|jgi:glycosyltransferase involved in cell wall biosynthesis|nr:glycosyltransferase family 4 protein [Solirubrobacteraceae bacterium]
MKSVLFVTGHAPRDRVGAFARLHEREHVEFALFGGHSQHGFEVAAGDACDAHPATDAAARAAARDLPFPHRHVAQRELGALAASGRYRAVVCSTGGRLALPAAWAGARRARTPLILWTSLWAHPRSAAHLASYLALRRLYRSADAVVTYGPHVSAYVRARGARNVHIAPQSVDNAFWAAPDLASAEVASAASIWPASAAVKFLFAGRASREKGSRALIEAWSDSGLSAPSAALVLVGVGSAPPWVPAGGAVRRDLVCLDPLAPSRLRALYAAADALVVPSIPTRTFREPWGLVVNEAMNRQLPVIASDAVGAVAGGLVRDGRNGLVAPAGDTAALARALRRLAADAPLRARLGAAAAADVRAYTHDAWAAGFSAALASLGLSGEGRW